MIEKNKVAEELKTLNAIGNDNSLIDTGNNRHYWYSVSDVMILLINVRQETLQYSHRNQKKLKLSAIQQNQNRIFLADPYYITNFAKYFQDDLSRIIGDHQEIALNMNAWSSMPRLILIPLLSGMHWRTIVIQINYETNNFSIVWDDPYGKFSEELKQNLRITIRINVLNLISKDKKINNLQMINQSLEEELNNKIYQQWQKCNGWDCGPIIISNIKDYIDQYSLKQSLNEIKYTVGNHNEEKFQKIVIGLRINHIKQYGNFAKYRIDNERLSQIRQIWEMKNKAQIQLIDKGFEGNISKLNGFYMSMFFTVLQNIKQSYQQNNREEAISYALNFVKAEMSYQEIRIKVQTYNHLLQNVAFFAILPNSTKYLSLQTTLNDIAGGRKRYENLMKQYHQNPNDKNSYKQSLAVIKQKLLNNLYQNDKQIINAGYTKRFYQKILPFLSTIVSLISPILENSINTIGNMLITKKQRQEPQIQLLRKYLIQNAQQLNLQKDVQVKKLNRPGRANDVYLVSNTKINQNNPNTIDYYAKTFSNDPRLFTTWGRIDPNQLFAYKILEYTGFGPQCYFLLKLGSSSDGTISRGNFILTKNLGKGDEVNFLLNTDKNQELFEQMFSNSKKFAVQISAAAAINDIICLWDTFNNFGNYGVVFYNNSLNNWLKDKKNLEGHQIGLKEIQNFKIIFLDHLPDSGNGLLRRLHQFKQSKDQRYNTIKYSPRNHLKRYQQKRRNILIELATNSKQKGFSKDEIINDVYQRLEGHQKGNTFKEALRKAFTDVEQKIQLYQSLFYKSEDQTAQRVLENYYKKILANIQIFDEKYRQDTTHRLNDRQSND